MFRVGLVIFMDFLNPVKILEELELGSDMIAADFGCGSGGFTIPLAKRLEKGLIYGLDIQKAPLSVLKSHCLTENITNIKIECCNLEKEKGSNLANSSVDLVLVSNILFQVKDKTAIISEAKRILKKRGKLLIIDWSPKATQGPEKARVSAKKVKKITEELKLKLKKEFEAGEYHYGIVFQKP